MKLNPAILATDTPPIPEARRWLDGLALPDHLPLLNVSQAAPTDPPPQALRQHIADLALTDAEAHFYGPVLGLPALRDAVAAEWRRGYGGDIRAAQVAITPGCNQAFVAVMTALAGAGDEVILPSPWYFNHKMALDMAGIRVVPLANRATPLADRATGLANRATALADRASLLPDPHAARDLITERTRAIVLVTPNNPTGVEYPADLVAEFRDIARAAGIALVLDETYRDFDSRPGAPHDLFTDPDWSDTVIDLYSFSKAYRLTGHRVGAIVASENLLHQVEKVQDTQVICASSLGQRAALWGMQNLAQWKAAERDEILARRAAVATHLGPIEGWEIRGLGAYFAYVTHPFDAPSDAVARALVKGTGILALPATMFAPETDPTRNQALRIAFANIDQSGIAEMSRRLEAFGTGPALAETSPLA